jgi:uncharacterized membrane protein YagU involved in acid resistance
VWLVVVQYYLLLVAGCVALGRNSGLPPRPAPLTKTNPPALRVRPEVRPVRNGSHDMTVTQPMHVLLHVVLHYTTHVHCTKAYTACMYTIMYCDVMCGLV